MPYELAKQLKDAGFPQKIVMICRNYDRNHPDCRCDRDDCKPEALGVPTLSELIEACGDGFVSLDRFGLTQLGRIQYVCNHEKAWRTEGATSEEAVAKLWLALKK